MRAEERIDDPQEALRLAIEGQITNIWTALPAIIQSVDYTKQTLSAQPAIQAQISDKNQNTQNVNLPLLVDVPFQCYGGADFVLTMPILEGSECLIVFASRCIDGWYQSGGIQPQAENRTHDLSDGFAIIGFNSQPKKIINYNTTAPELRTRDGSTKITLAPNLVTITSTNVHITGALQVDGTATINNTMHSTGAITTTSTVTATGEVTGNGKNLSTHVHSGVQTGSSNTGMPV